MCRTTYWAGYPTVSSTKFVASTGWSTIFPASRLRPLGGSRGKSPGVQEGYTAGNTKVWSLAFEFIAPVCRGYVKQAMAGGFALLTMLVAAFAESKCQFYPTFYLINTALS